MSDDVETVGCEGHEHGERRAAVECGEHLLAVTDALLLMRQQHKSVPSMARDEDQGEERGEERSQEEEEEEAMGSVRPKTRALYSLFSKVPVSRPIISSAGEKAPSDSTLLASNGF